MFLKSKQFAKAVMSFLILVCFMANMIPNQAIHSENFVSDESSLLVNEIDQKISRNENYDLGIDSIEIQDTGFFVEDSCPNLDCELVMPYTYGPIQVIVTNHGSEPVDEVIVNLMIKTVEGGLVQYDVTLSSEAFSDGHPMHISETTPLEPGHSTVFTFNKTNYRYQLIFDGEDGYTAQNPSFLLAGFGYVQAKILGEDIDSTNDHFRQDVEVVKFLDNGEHQDALGSSCFAYYHCLERGDWDDIVPHRATDFDHDADGCGWARDCDNEGTDNVSAALTGNSSYGFFNWKGWFKDGANSSECDWDVFDDLNCPKFTLESYQGENNHWNGYSQAFIPGQDLRGMRDMKLEFSYRGNLQKSEELFECTDGNTILFHYVNDGNEDCYDGTDEPENASYFNCTDGGYAYMIEVNDFYPQCDDGSDERSGGIVKLQIRSDVYSSWSNLVVIDSSETSWDWQTIVLDEEIIGDTYADYSGASFRFVVGYGNHSSSGTECNGSPCSVFFIDNIFIRGSEDILVDFAITDISVREGDDMIVKDPEDSMSREINFTVANFGSADYGNYVIWLSAITDPGTEDEYSHQEFDNYEFYGQYGWPGYGNSKYGDITQNEDQTGFFVLFQAPYSSIYHIEIEVAGAPGRDFFPSNNSMTVKVCIFDGDDDDDDCVGNLDDDCPSTPTGLEVDESGCSDSQKDSDNDGIMDNVDSCPNTIAVDEVDQYGCSDSQKDSDNDGITDDIDECPDTIVGDEVADSGCSDSQKDSDNDGITDDMDECPDTLTGEEVDSYGCSNSQKDSDNDGIVDSDDQCPDTPAGEEVDEIGCKLEKSEEENKEDTATEKPDDSGPELESLEEESEISSLGLVAAIFSIFAIALVRRD